MQFFLSGDVKFTYWRNKKCSDVGFWVKWHILFQLLTVFAYPDQVGETFSRAAEKLGFEVTSCNSDVAALEEYQSKSHDLVLVDTRSSRAFDYETICR